MINIRGIVATEPIRIIVGSGGQRWRGWIPTDKEELNLLNPEDWEKSFRFRRADAFLCEHVWEHLSEAEGRRAAELCYKWLKPGGYLRCAVPDGYFPNKYYQQVIGVGGMNTPAHPSVGHKVVYNHKLLSDVFIQAGFKVELLEYCDKRGRFHYNQWSAADGPVYRSLLLDRRNQYGKIISTSLIIDAKKPPATEASPLVKCLVGLCSIIRSQRNSIGKSSPASL